MPRYSRQYFESANRNQLRAFLERNGKEVYRDESTAELRDAAIHFWEDGQPDENPGLSFVDA